MGTALASDTLIHAATTAVTLTCIFKGDAPTGVAWTFDNGALPAGYTPTAVE